MNEEKLVESVRNFPCLWEMSSRSFKDIRAKGNAWKKVAEEVGSVTVEDCNKKWKNMRDAFVRELRKSRARKSGDEGPPYVSRWPYFEIMGFLSDTVKHRQTFSNFGPQTVETEEISVPEDMEESFQQQLGDIASEDQSPPPTPASAATSSSLTKRAKKLSAGDMADMAIVKSLQQLQDRQLLQKEDIDFNFALEVAGRLKRLSSRKNALAKLKIQEVLFNIEFQEEQ